MQSIIQMGEIWFGAILVDYFAIRGTTSVLQVSKGRAVEEEEENKMSTKLEKKSTYFGDSSYSSSTSPPRHQTDAEPKT